MCALRVLGSLSPAGVARLGASYRTTGGYLAGEGPAGWDPQPPLPAQFPSVRLRPPLSRPPLSARSPRSLLDCVHRPVRMAIDVSQLARAHGPCAHRTGHGPQARPVRAWSGHGCRQRLEVDPRFHVRSGAWVEGWVDRPSTSPDQSEFSTGQQSYFLECDDGLASGCSGPARCLQANGVRTSVGRASSRRLAVSPFLGGRLAGRMKHHQSHIDTIIEQSSWACSAFGQRDPPLGTGPP